MIKLLKVTSYVFVILIKKYRFKITPIPNRNIELNYSTIHHDIVHRVETIVYFSIESQECWSNQTFCFKEFDNAVYTM